MVEWAIGGASGSPVLKQQLDPLALSVGRPPGHSTSRELLRLDV